jgi:hypothetical protein
MPEGAFTRILVATRGGHEGAYACHRGKII